MELSTGASFLNGELIGDLSYVLLIVSMAMRNIFWLRVLAILSGICGAAYDYIWLDNPGGAYWELLFTLVNLVQWCWLLHERRARYLDPFETKLKSDVFPLLTVLEFQRLMKTGLKEDFFTGDILQRRGKRVELLYLILAGKADIEVDDQRVSVCESGDFIGEIGFLYQVPASATVRASESMRCVVFDVHDLRQFMRRSPDFERGFNQALSANLATKLLRRNALTLPA